MPDVLGYSDNGQFDAVNMPPALQSWLKDCAEAANYARENHLPKHQSAMTRGTGKSVGPLLTTKWGQGSPYNDGYPQVNGSTCLTGCVATAMAQILNYHKHPKGMTAEVPGYISMSFSIEMPTLAPTTFDWANMQDVYTNKSTAAQKAAVSKLMMYCTTAARADLGPGETSAYSPEPAFKKYFGYGNGARKIFSTDVVSDVRKELIFTELDEHRPFIGMGGNASGGGHAYVIDGYDANGLLSVNWGWYGSDNGFYNMMLAFPAPGLYSLSEMVIGISPEDIQLEYVGEEVVLTSIIGEQPMGNYYMYGNQCNVKISAIHTNNLKGTYDIDYNWAIYQNGLFVENLYSEKDEIHTYNQMARGNKLDDTYLLLPSSDSKNLGKLFVEPGAYKLVPVSRKHGTEDWIENICTNMNCLTIISFQDQYGITNLRVYGGEPTSTVAPAQLTAVKNTYQGLKEAAEAKLSTVDQNAKDIETLKESQQALIELEEKVVDYGELDLQIRGMQFGDKKPLWAEFSPRFNALKTKIEDVGSLSGVDFLESDNSALKDNLKHYVKTAKGEIAMAQYIMNDQELKESQQRSVTLSQKIEACDITVVTQEVKNAMQTLDNLNLKELKSQVTALAVDVNIALNGGGKAGDADGNGDVNEKDIVEVANAIMGKPSAQFRKYAADLNADGEVDAADLVLLIDRLK